MGAALSKRPHLNRAYVVTVPFILILAVYQNPFHCANGKKISQTHFFQLRVTQKKPALGNHYQVYTDTSTIHTAQP